ELDTAWLDAGGQRLRRLVDVVVAVERRDRGDRLCRVLVELDKVMHGGDIGGMQCDLVLSARREDLDDVGADRHPHVLTREGPHGNPRYVDAPAEMNLVSALRPTLGQGERLVSRPHRGE